MWLGSLIIGMWLDNMFIIVFFGNLGVCFIGFYLFVELVLVILMGKDIIEMIKVCVKMVSDYIKNNGYDCFLWGIYCLFDEGEYLVELVGSDMLSVLGNFYLIICLFKIFCGKVGKLKGEEVEVWLLFFK